MVLTSTRTAVAAPDAFDDLFAFLDKLTYYDLIGLVIRFQLLLNRKRAGER